MEELLWSLAAVIFTVGSFWLVYQIAIRLFRRVFGKDVTLFGQRDD